MTDPAASKRGRIIELSPIGPDGLCTGCGTRPTWETGRCKCYTGPATVVARPADPPASVRMDKVERRPGLDLTGYAEPASGDVEAARAAIAWLRATNQGDAVAIAQRLAIETDRRKDVEAARLRQQNHDAAAKRDRETTALRSEVDHYRNANERARLLVRGTPVDWSKDAGAQSPDGWWTYVSHQTREVLTAAVLAIRAEADDRIADLEQRLANCIVQGTGPAFSAIRAEAGTLDVERLARAIASVGKNMRLAASAEAIAAEYARPTEADRGAYILAIEAEAGTLDANAESSAYSRGYAAGRHDAEAGTPDVERWQAQARAAALDEAFDAVDKTVLWDAKATTMGEAAESVRTRALAAIDALREVDDKT